MGIFGAVAQANIVGTTKNRSKWNKDRVMIVLTWVF